MAYASTLLAARLPTWFREFLETVDRDVEAFQRTSGRRLDAAMAGRQHVEIKCGARAALRVSLLDDAVRIEEKTAQPARAGGAPGAPPIAAVMMIRWLTWLVFVVGLGLGVALAMLIQQQLAQLCR